MKTDTITTISNAKLIEKITAQPARSAWARGVKAYAIEMIEDAEVELASVADIKKALLIGAQDWAEYSYGGCALIYDADIAERLCSASELKKTRNGASQPNARETWLDCQARACGQAARLIANAIRAN